jgi:hypothetical protein
LKNSTKKCKVLINLKFQGKEIFEKYYLKNLIENTENN